MGSKAFDGLVERFKPVLNDFLAIEPIQRLASGDISTEEYRSYMKQVYYYVRENPQIQTLGTAYFRGRQRFMVRNVYKHAISEVGHEQLALNDYVELGGDGSIVPYLNPHPATIALTSYAYYQIYNLNPMGYLGYLFFLEFAPTQAGPAISEQLLACGIPEKSLTWLREHIDLDQGHTKMMERYVEALLTSEADLDSVEYAMKTTGFLYARMIDAAFEDVKAPMNTGWSWEELQADGKTPGDFAAVKVVA
jgi:hypothetical protein